MKIYLDTCAIQRPVDNKTQFRIILESEAVLGVLSLLENEKIEIVSSDVLLFETQQNPNETRREYALEVLSKASGIIQLNSKIKKRAEQFSSQGIKPLDALHLASAEIGQVDYFCTCDDKLLRKAKSLSDVFIKVVSPNELILEIEK
ncbi:MAG: type II toxin-antitoxin system VapC family toxin [Calditrichaeota bacterium]|nr:type II toxin-antitoxin system VapC family toxin [Calditrichota bacterium]